MFFYSLPISITILYLPAIINITYYIYMGCTYLTSYLTHGRNHVFHLTWPSLYMVYIPTYRERIAFLFNPDTTNHFNY